MIEGKNLKFSLLAFELYLSHTISVHVLYINYTADVFEVYF